MHVVDDIRLLFLNSLQFGLNKVRVKTNIFSLAVVMPCDLSVVCVDAPGEIQFSYIADFRWS